MISEIKRNQNDRGCHGGQDLQRRMISHEKWPEPANKKTKKPPSYILDFL